MNKKHAELEIIKYIFMHINARFFVGRLIHIDQQGT